MKTNKFLLPIICIGLIAMSCSKSSNPAAPVTTTVAQQSFTNTSSDVSAAIGGLNSAPGAVALNSFAGLNSVSSPLGRIRAFNKPGDIKMAMTAGISSIREMLMKTTANKRVEGGSFDFAGKIGTYTWSKANQKWNYTSGGGIIKIDYPSDTTSSTNDTELQITAYSEKQIGTDYYPTNIEAAIYQPIGDAKQLGLSLTVGYDDTGSENYASVSLFINPYTISFTVDDRQATSTTESFSFSKGSTVYIGTSGTAVYASAADKADPNGHPSAVTGYLQLETVRFDVAIDGTTQSNNPNDFVTGTVTVNGGLAGTIVFVFNDQTQKYDPYIQYNDPNEQPQALKDAFQDLSAQLSSLGLG